MVRRGWRVLQLGIAASGEPRIGRLNGVVLIRRPRPRYRGAGLLRYLTAYLGFFFWVHAVLRRVARRGRINVVQVNNIPNLMIWSASFLRRRGARLILDIHDPEAELLASKFGNRRWVRPFATLLEWEERLASRAADTVFCVNETHREMTIAHGVDRDKLHVVLNVADGGLFPLRAPRAPTPFVVYHGTVAHRMGLDVVLEALARLPHRGLVVTAALWGDGDAVEDLRVLRDRLGLTETVEIPGRREPIERLVTRLNHAGLGIVPLRRDPITDVMLPTKLMEYVRLGIPALVTWTPTVARYFPPDTVTYLDDFTPNGVAGGICAVLSNPDGTRDRARRAQQLSVARAWQDCEAEFIRIMEET
jgi:glycosyltransferase involved in cell wall biosynthesis